MSAPVPVITAEQIASAAEPAPLAGPLNASTWQEQPLFGGAIVAAIPKRFSDCSQFRVIPDHQEVWADGDSDQSIIIELNSYDESIADSDAPAHYMAELAVANDALSSEIVTSGVISHTDMPGFGADSFKSFCICSQRISKYHESAEKANVVQIYLAVVRLKTVTTDLLISFNVPTAFGHGSSSEGRSIMSSAENVAVIQGVLRTLAVKDWSLFGGDK